MNLDPVILAELQRGGPAMWASGRTYPAGAEVRSPTNLQRYVRIAAGSGTTDPSADSANWLLWSKRVEDAIATVSTSVTQLAARVDTLGKLWATGAVIDQGALVISPADRETYRRTSATGAAATDPADDTANYAAVSYSRVTALPNPGATYAIPTADQVRGVAKTAQVNVAAGARTLVLSVSGRGQLLHVGAFRDAPSADRGARIEIQIDGRKVYEWEGYGSSPHYTTHHGSVNRIAAGDFVTLMATHGSPAAFRRSLAVYLTPTYADWAASANFVGYAVRMEA